MIASNVLSCKNIAMIGMDFSYYEHTKLEQTQYYGILKKNFEKKILKNFIKKFLIQYIKNISTLIMFMIGIRIYF